MRLFGLWHPLDRFVPLYLSHLFGPWDPWRLFQEDLSHLFGLWDRFVPSHPFDPSHP